MPPIIRFALPWLLIVWGILEVLRMLFRREELPAGVAYGQMVTGAGWVVVGLCYLAPFASVPAQDGVLVGLSIVIIGQWISWRARNSSQL